MGAGRPLFDPNDRRRSTARLSSARSLQWFALDGSWWLILENDAARSAALLRRLPTDATVAQSWSLRSDHPRSAGRAQNRRRAAGNADSLDLRQPDDAIDSRERRSRR